jgi:hypothetical protein
MAPIARKYPTPVATTSRSLGGEPRGHLQRIHYCEYKNKHWKINTTHQGTVQLQAEVSCSQTFSSSPLGRTPMCLTFSIFFIKCCNKLEYDPLRGKRLTAKCQALMATIGMEYQHRLIQEVLHPNLAFRHGNVRTMQAPEILVPHHRWCGGRRQRSCWWRRGGGSWGRSGPRRRCA